MFVAGFIGEPPMNFFEASLKSSDGRVVIETSSFKLELPQDLSNLLQPHVGREVVAGIRPGELRISKYGRGFSKRDIVLEAKTVVNEPMGDRQYVIVDINGTNMKGVADIREPNKYW